MLQVSSVSKDYGNIKALDNVSLKVLKGEFFGILGPNGAGKTSLINIISLLLKPDSGDVKIGENSSRYSVKQCKKILGLVPQEIALYEELSAIDNMMFWGRPYSIPNRQIRKRSNELLQMTGLSDRARSRISTFSGGMKRRLNIACALIHQPQLIIMDEPTVGIDPQSREFVYKLLKEFHSRGHTILYTSHYLDEFEKLCDRVAIMDKGKVLAMGSIPEVRKKYAPHDIILVYTNGIEPTEIHGLNRFDHEFRKDHIVFKTSDANRSLPLIIENLNKNKVRILHIDVKRSGLENVFFNLTGTYLRD